MSQPLPQSKLGKVKTKAFVDGFARISVIDDRASEILNINPVDTVWGRRSGRPVYDRLPGVSQGYKEEYAGEVGTGLVYIEPQFGKYSGPGSLEVGIWQNDPKVLIVYSGTITWAKGQVPTSTLAINFETVIDGGIQDGEYQIGYYLDESIPADTGTTKFEVTAYSLAASTTLYSTNKIAKNHSLAYCISDNTDGYWTPTEFNDAGAYSDGSWIVFDFTAPVKTSSFEVIGLNSQLTTAKCALYRSDDAINWELADVTSASGNKWVVNNSEGTSQYYKLYFWDGKVTVSEVRYSGEAFYLNQRPSGPISSAQIFLEPAYDQIDRPHILLGLIRVQNYEITSLQDARNFTSTKYEPVASWLTSFQDDVLRKLITDISGYASLYLSPTTGASSFYEDLLQSGVELGSELSVPRVVFPNEVELDPPTIVMNQQVETSTVNPSGIYYLSSPTDASDLSPKSYVDQTFIVTLDDGKY